MIDRRSDVLNRMIDESAELTTKVEKLTAFVGVDSFDTVNPVQKELLHKQLSAMIVYRDILDERIRNLENL